MDHVASKPHREYWTLTAWAKERSGVILNPISRLLAKMGVQPNLLSMIGFFAAASAGAVVAAGYVSIGGWLWLLSGPFDALDGALARTTGRESRFGAFLDSFLDRYSDAAVLFGIVWWATFRGEHIIVLLCFLTMFGSLMVSYARARAGALKISCRVGIFTRLERFIVLTFTLLTEQLLIGLVVLAFLANFTALQRMFHVYRHSLHE